MEISLFKKLKEATACRLSKITHFLTSRLIVKLNNEVNRAVYKPKYLYDCITKRSSIALILIKCLND